VIGSNVSHAVKTYGASGCTVPWRVISFTLQPLYAMAKSARYALDGTEGPFYPSGRSGKHRSDANGNRLP
jgi:hypothetical protein